MQDYYKLKVSPEKALQVIEGYFVRGNNVIDEIAVDRGWDKMRGGYDVDNLNRCNLKITAWDSEVVEGLTSIFEGQMAIGEFKSPANVAVETVDVFDFGFSNAFNRMKVQVEMLRGFYKDISDMFGIELCECRESIELVFDGSRLFEKDNPENGYPMMSKGFPKNLMIALYQHDQLSSGRSQVIRLRAIEGYNDNVKRKFLKNLAKTFKVSSEFISEEIVVMKNGIVTSGVSLTFI